MCARTHTHTHTHARTYHSTVISKAYFFTLGKISRLKPEESDSSIYPVIYNLRHKKQ